MSSIWKREDLLRPDKRRFACVDVPGGTVRIRSLTEFERQRLAAEMRGKDANSEQADCRIVVAGAVDEDGNPLLTNDDIHPLLARDSAVVRHISGEIQKHWGLDENFEAIKKNLGETPIDALPSSSPAQSGTPST